MILSSVYMLHSKEHAEKVSDIAAPALLPVFRSRLQGEVLALIFAA